MASCQITLVQWLTSFIRQDKKSVLTIGCFLILSCAKAGDLFPVSDSLKKDNFALHIELAAGTSYYSTAPSVPLHLESKVYKFQPIFTGKISWQTDHRLAISLESGYFRMYSYTFKGQHENGELQIDCIPILLEFSMPLFRRLHIMAGAGSYLQTTKLQYLGKVISHSTSLGWTAGGTYFFYIRNRTAAGVMVKWLNASESEQAAMAVELSYRYTLHKW